MKNVTISIPDDIYRQARIWAAQRDTSLSRVVAYLLATLPSRRTRAEQRFPLATPAIPQVPSSDVPPAPAQN